jgi:hypothetical protein
VRSDGVDGGARPDGVDGGALPDGVDRGALTEDAHEVEPDQSFAIVNSGDGRASIQTLTLADGRYLQETMRDATVWDVAAAAAEGIRREGSRRLDGERDEADGIELARELLSGGKFVSTLLLKAAELYTRDTFLYRRVNKFLRDDGPIETGRNLGVYIGLLRECFSVQSSRHRVKWSRPDRVYRGAQFRIDVVADYFRSAGDVIRFPCFASSSSRKEVALAFPGNVLFDVALVDVLPSLSDISAFKDEDEFVLSPYLWFSLGGIHWDGECGRWVISILDTARPEVPSWLRSRLDSDMDEMDLVYNLFLRP